MSNYKKKKNLAHRSGYPGGNKQYIECFICGAKVRAEEARIINDPYSDRVGMIVCQRDFDRTNQQQSIKAIREYTTRDRVKIRTEPAEVSIVVADDDRVPSAPRDVFVVGADENGVELRWQGPEDTGSSCITGYRISRSDPCGSAITVINSNTNSPVMRYIDSTAVLTTEYGYLVQAINGAGVGSRSEEICYPPSAVVGSFRYYITENNFNLFSEDSKFYIPED